MVKLGKERAWDPVWPAKEEYNFAVTSLGSVECRNFR